MLPSDDHLDAEIDREHRIAMTREVAIALVDGRRPNPEAASFVGSAILSHLRGAGDLARHCLRITAPRGSHRRPDVIAREFSLSSSAMKDDSAE